MRLLDGLQRFAGVVAPVAEALVTKSASFVAYSNQLPIGILTRVSQTKADLMLIVAHLCTLAYFHNCLLTHHLVDHFLLLLLLRGQIAPAFGRSHIDLIVAQLRNCPDLGLGPRPGIIRYFTASKEVGRRADIPAMLISIIYVNIAITSSASQVCHHILLALEAAICL